MDNKDDKANPNEAAEEEQGLLSRRDFLISLTKWSKVVIAGALLGGLLTHSDKKAQAGSWINRRGGYGGGWYNRGGSWYDGRGGWYDGRGGWYDGRGDWYNRPRGGTGWINTGRGGWINRRGGLGWINRR
jgi:hypothetical protein